MRNIPIGRVVHEEFLLAFQCCGHRFVRIDILLTPIHDPNEPEFERVCPAGQDIISVCSCIHEVKLGEDPDGPTALGVYGASELQRLRVSKINICGGNRKYDTESGRGSPSELCFVKGGLMRRRTSLVWRCSLGRGFVFDVRCRSVDLQQGSGYEAKQTGLVSTDEILESANVNHGNPQDIADSGVLGKTPTLVSPGKSTNVRSKTFGLYIRRLIGSLLIPLFWPATLNVSRSISFRISSKSVNRLST